MKTYIFTYTTAYGLGITIIKAYSEKEAIEIAEKDNFTWSSHNPVCVEKLPQKLGVCFQEHS